jgi:hypothetical protein
MTFDNTTFIFSCRCNLLQTTLLSQLISLVVNHSLKAVEVAVNLALTTYINEAVILKLKYLRQPKITQAR